MQTGPKTGSSEIAELYRIRRSDGVREMPRDVPSSGIETWMTLQLDVLGD